MLVLRELNSSDENSFMTAVRKWPNKDRDWITFDWRPGISFMDHLAKLQRDSLGIGLLEGKVPHTMLYGFIGDEIIGRVSVRHRLNDKLLQRGGHVGYAVNFDQRRKGYASEMFRQSLEFCGKLGLMEIIVTASDTNEASWRVIEKFDFRLENKVWDQENREHVRRYWIKTILSNDTIKE